MIKEYTVMTIIQETKTDDTIPSFHLYDIVRFAFSEGASDARAIAASDILVEEKFAKLCAACPSYGFSHSCPPQVSGPSGFRELQKQLPWAVAVRLVVPLSALFSAERQDLGRFLHELTSGIEAYAVGMGYTDSRAFAGGSCKGIFCREHSECRRLSGGLCRHPEHARPSMSGFGIDVLDLMKKCGWPSEFGGMKTTGDGESMSWLAGLVMIG